MENKLAEFVRRYDMIQPGDTVIAAVSGGADSVALLFGLYLLRDVLPFTLEAAHFNHHLRGEESDRDAAFVQSFCDRYDIPLHMGGGTVVPGEKGLEAAARDARYQFLRSLPGKIATAHTADDNAETILMHLIRGTGLKGLGGIAPVLGNVIRPMLEITRGEVEAFLAEYYLPHVEDSSNHTDAFLRNRIRHHVMPLLKQENPRLAENLSGMAQRLRLDEDCLRSCTLGDLPDVERLKQMHPAIRRRWLEQFLKDSGVREPEEVHISAAEALLYNNNPSARGNFPGGVVISREYDRLVALRERPTQEARVLPVPGKLIFPDLGICIVSSLEEQTVCTVDAFTVETQGEITVRSRQSGDAMRLKGGTKQLKKLFIDRKIPAAARQTIPVLADTQGVLGVYGIGANLDRVTHGTNGVTIRFEKIERDD